MENKFIPQAIEIVTLAIKEDNSKNYEEAFRLYKKALEHFMVGVKCTSSCVLPVACVTVYGSYKLQLHAQMRTIRRPKRSS